MEGNNPIRVIAELELDEFTSREWALEIIEGMKNPHWNGGAVLRTDAYVLPVKVIGEVGDIDERK